MKKSFQLYWRSTLSTSLLIAICPNLLSTLLKINFIMYLCNLFFFISFNSIEDQLCPYAQLAHELSFSFLSTLLKINHTLHFSFQSRASLAFNSIEDQQWYRHYPTANDLINFQLYWRSTQVILIWRDACLFSPFNSIEDQQRGENKWQVQ